MVNMTYQKAWLFLFLVLFLLCPAVSTAKMLVGVIFSGNIPYYRSMHVAFLNELKQQQRVEADIKFVTQFPAPDPVSLSNAAKKLIVGGVDMIISYGHPATNAVLAKESEIPVLYAGVYDPVATVDGRNVTGCGYKVPLSGLLRYYRQVADIQRLCVVYSPSEVDSVRQINELAGLAEQHNIDLLRLDIRSRGDLKKLDDLVKGDAVFLTGSTQVHVMIKDLLAVLREKKIPAVDIFPDSSEEGVLITLHHVPELQGQSAAEIFVQMIGGEPVDQIEPVVQTSTELVFNSIEAKNLGTTFPNELIGEFTRIVD